MNMGHNHRGRGIRKIILGLSFRYAAYWHELIYIGTLVTHKHTHIYIYIYKYNNLYFSNNNRSNGSSMIN